MALSPISPSRIASSLASDKANKMLVAGGKKVYGNNSVSQISHQTRSKALTDIVWKQKGSSGGLKVNVSSIAIANNGTTVAVTGRFKIGSSTFSLFQVHDYNNDHLQRGNNVIFEAPHVSLALSQDGNILAIGVPIDLDNNSNGLVQVY